MSRINTIIFDPIEVKLTEEDIKNKMSDRAIAQINLPNGSSFFVSKYGSSVDVSECNLYEGDQLPNTKLYIYDRQPDSGYYFTVSSTRLKAKDGVARLKFNQNYPAICFHLVNSE